MLRINWVAFNYHKCDGYGRYAMHMIRALNRRGVDVRPYLTDQVRLPGWMQRMAGIDYSRLTITCTPPYMLCAVPGRQWNLTMTEGTRLPDGWTPHVNLCAQRVIVPCEHNRAAFVDSGVTAPVSVSPGGTSPQEFPLVRRDYGDRQSLPYTFLALGDRGSRKGWVEVYSAFYAAFGSPDDTPDVRLLIKTRPHSNSLIDTIMGAKGRDPRVDFWCADVDDMADVFAFADAFAIPSRSEGWGMPHREAAMTGLPVITTRYSGLDDGHTDEWALAIDNYRLEAIPANNTMNIAGEWCRADIPELAERMRWCYDNREAAAERGQRSAQWLRENQTWDHAADALIALIEEHN